jgi:hypothetical protein
MPRVSAPPTSKYTALGFDGVFGLFKQPYGSDEAEIM